MKTFPERLRWAYQERGLTQEQFAEALGVRQKNVSVWVNGRSDPNLASLTRIIDVLGCSSEWLLSGRGEPFASPGEAELRLAAVRHAIEAPIAHIAPTPPVTAEESATLDEIQQAGEDAEELQKQDRQKRSAPDNEGAA